MATTIDISTGTHTLAELLALVRRGEEVIVREHNVSVARIEPFVQAVPASERTVAPKPLILGNSAGKLWMSDDFDDELPDEFWLGEDE